ncbi:MAG: sodium-dependent transporter [Candidatus Latescibacterota bacterium]
MASANRESWGSRLGIILAVAGSAVGLGNFLRFPVQAAQNGGGAFLIPYFVSLVLLGFPLMLIEWTLGRYGGQHGYGTAPSIFAVATRNHFLKYFGVVGIFAPLVIFIYYSYVESWLLGFAYQSLFGSLMQAAADGSVMKDYLLAYQGVVQNSWFGGIGQAYFFFILTFAINFFVIYKGIHCGIEWFCKVAMPILLLLGIVIAVRVLTLGAPIAAHPDWNIVQGLGFLWNPDFTSLKDAKVWMAAAGQVFFTLSVGQGMILTYASYLNRKDDVTLNSLTSASLNEFAEVILGGSIVIPAAFVFMGPMAVSEVANSGSFNLGFVTMPQIFSQMQAGGLFAFMWFVMLFFAGITSSISMLQPAVAFVDEEFRTGRKKASLYIMAFGFVACNGVILGIAHGVMDELDFWGGTFCLVLFATVEAIVFGWVFGIDRAWKETHFGADIRVPLIFKFVIKYVTSTILIAILVTWTVQKAIPTLRMEGIPLENRLWVLGTRLFLVLFVLVLTFLVFRAWRGRDLPAIDNEVDRELAS